MQLVFGDGYEQAERKMLFFFSEERKEYLQEQALEEIKVLRINLPHKAEEILGHKQYLGGILKLGVERKKIGDILVRQDGADILVSTTMLKFLLTNLPELKRFSGAKMQEVTIQELIVPVIEKQIKKVIVSSLRLDNIVAKLAGVSREGALQMLKMQRVFVNFLSEIKPTKLVQEGSVITIRGKGRFSIKQIEGNTKKGRIILVIECMEN